MNRTLAFSFLHEVHFMYMEAVRIEIVMSKIITVPPHHQ